MEGPPRFQIPFFPFLLSLSVSETVNPKFILVESVNGHCGLTFLIHTLQIPCLHHLWIFCFFRNTQHLQDSLSFTKWRTARRRRRSKKQPCSCAPNLCSLYCFDSKSFVLFFQFLLFSWSSRCLIRFQKGVLNCVRRLVRGLVTIIEAKISVRFY